MALFFGSHSSTFYSFELIALKQFETNPQKNLLQFSKFKLFLNKIISEPNILKSERNN